MALRSANDISKDETLAFHAKLECMVNEYAGKVGATEEAIWVLAFNASSVTLLHAYGRTGKGLGLYINYLADRVNVFPSEKM